MPNLTVNGRRVDYTEYHLRTGPIPLLFLAEERDWWSPVANLMPWDYSVIAVQWSGDTDLTATNALGLAEALKMPWAHIVGFGAGARSALLAAARAPQRVRSITAVAPFANAMTPDAALPWERVTGLTTPILLLEPDNSTAEARAAFDRLLDLLPNGRPDLLRGWEGKLSDSLARRLAAAIVNQAETAYDATTPVGVSAIRS